MVRIRFSDPLRREGYFWPKTLLTRRVTFDPPAREDCLRFRDGEGRELPFQLSGVRGDGEGLREAELSFLADLPSGAEREYTLRWDEAPARAAAPEETLPFAVEADAENALLLIRGEGGSVTLKLPLPVLSWERTAEGPVYAETRLVCGEGEKRCELSVRVIRELPFFELRETMRGFSAEESAAAELCFEGIDFLRRYSWMRPVEKIDDYLREDGTLPVTLMPYENWVSWCQSKYAAFTDGRLCAGLFLRDCAEWKEEGYPIWGSTRSFGIRCRCAEGALTALFPMKNGSRSTAVAFWPGSDVTGIRRLWTRYALTDLNKVSRWILEWDEPRGDWPRYFPRSLAEHWCGDSLFGRAGEALPPERMDEVIDSLSHSVRVLPGEDEQGMTPMGNREFSEWAALADLTAPKMTDAQFDRAKAFFAFMAYVTRDENYMPTRNLLGGHPNFLADTAAVSGLFSAIFPNHPEAGEFRDYFNRTVEANLRYHVRPDVAAYESLGGRETESTVTYALALLRPYLHVYTLFAARGDEIALRSKNGAKFLNWLLNVLSAPVNGRRTIPQQGAHARVPEIPYQLNLFAQIMERDYPELAENVYAACKGSELVSFEIDPPEADPYRRIFRRRDSDRLRLRSEKFTGYGCVFREAVGTPDEISLHVQQLDRGPNYRWGCFENTGNGGVFYYAAGKRWSFTAREDAGDRNLGAEEGTCGFSVLIGHTYHNIGFRELTEPMFDFPLCKQIRLLPDERVRAYYAYRRVSLIGKDYAVFYDALTHMRACGRFHWSVNAAEDWPLICQLLPGCPAVYPEKTAASFVTGNGDANEIPEALRSRGIYYEGNGSFLTLVSHRTELRAERTPFGAEVTLPEGRDLLFEDRARIRYAADGVVFDGHSGILRRRGGEWSGALTEGTRLAAGGFSAELAGEAGLYFEPDGAGRWRGALSARRPCSVTLCGRAATLEAGRYEWRLGETLTLTRLPDRTYDSNREFVRDTRRHEFGFNGYDFEDVGEILTYPD